MSNESAAPAKEGPAEATCDTSPREFARRLKRLRLAANLSQQRLAARLGCDYRTIQRHEQGLSTPSDLMVAAYCREFPVDEAWLLGRRETTDPSAITPVGGHPAIATCPTCGLTYALRPPDRTGRGAQTVETHVHRIPVYDPEGAAEMGHDDRGVPTDKPDEYVFIPASFLPEDPELYGVRHHGEAMRPDFDDGDVIIYSPGSEEEFEDGNCARVVFADGTSELYRVFRDGDKLRLRPSSANFPEQIVKRRQVLAIHPMVGRYQVRKK